MYFSKGFIRFGVKWFQMIFVDTVNVLYLKSRIMIPKLLGFLISATQWASASLGVKGLVEKLPKNTLVPKPTGHGFNSKGCVII